MKKNKIIFEAHNDVVFDIVEKPVPASKLIPQWWKDIPKYSTGDRLKMYPAPGITVKQCAPTLDMFQTGYIITLWQDILVQQENGWPAVYCHNPVPMVEPWPESQSQNFELPDGFSKPIFKYSHKWIIKTPPGWSTLFIHPYGYEKSPIRAISGIVDTDILKTDINCPFVIKEGFEGVIKKGTPMAQLIPIKRENWEAEYIKPENNNSLVSEVYKMKTELYGYYASRRQKKSYR